MRNYVVLLCLAVFFVACDRGTGKHTDTVSVKKKLMEVDKAFSDMSEAKGMKNAFIEYMDSNATLLRPDHLPIVGANAVDYLIQQDDADYTLSWEPQAAEVSMSADLGYTYGVYRLKFKSKDTTLYGTYLSIWKKQKDGKWKFVLDTGNDGVEADEP